MTASEMALVDRIGKLALQAGTTGQMQVMPPTPGMLKPDQPETALAKCEKAILAKFATHATEARKLTWTGTAFYNPATGMTNDDTNISWNELYAWLDLKAQA